MKNQKKIWHYNQLLWAGKRVVAWHFDWWPREQTVLCGQTLWAATTIGSGESLKLQSTTMQYYETDLSQNETMQKLGSKITCKCQFKQNNIMQHYKVCCSKQFPTLFSLPQACPCCMLCAICVKNAARDELLSGGSSSHHEEMCIVGYNPLRWRQTAYPA